MTTITALPTPPSRDDPANFATRADDFLGALPTFVTEANTVAGEVNSNASTASTAASTATTQAGIATTQAGTATTKAGEANSSAISAAASANTAASYAMTTGIKWTYQSSTVMADPSAGNLRLNNATVASVTAIAVSAQSADSGNPNVRSFVLTWDDSTNTAARGTLVLRKVGAPEVFAVFTISGALTDNTTWVQLAVTHVASSGALSASDNLMAQWTRTGDKGADGAGSGDFSSNTATSVDSEIVLFSGTGGKTGKRATTTGLLKATSGVLGAVVSGTDIKTINGTSLLGSGDITAGASVVRSARTSNTILAAGDKGTYIDITANTFTQTFTAAATLGSGWFCYIKNSGTGEITLDPNASETIDGLTSYKMYQNECRLIQCDGSGFNSFVLQPFVLAISSTLTFTKPPGYTAFKVELWGAGGGGGSGGKAAANSGTGGAGGGGGAYKHATILASAVGATETITIGGAGTGGTAISANTTAGNNGIAGGNTTFGSLLTAYGGGLGQGGKTSLATNSGGDGGGSLGTGSGSPNDGDTTSGTYGFGGGAGGSTSQVGKPAGYGGGGGADTGAGNGGYAGGGSAYGGGGGGSGAGNNSEANGGAGGSRTGVSGGGGAGGVASTSTVPPNQTTFGYGGGGGYYRTTATAGCSAGANGGIAAGGGGGGAGLNSTFDSGKGGDGGSGYAIISGGIA